MTEEGIDTGGKIGMSRKLVAGILALVIVISSVAGAIFLLNRAADKPFFQYSMSGMDGSDGVVGGIIVTDPPVLNGETSMIHWRNYDNAIYTTENQYRFFQIFLPDSIELLNGSKRLILEPGEPWNVTWRIKVTQTGDFFIKIGYVRDPDINITRMYDEEFDYYEMGTIAHFAQIIGLRVGEDYGEIIDMGPGGGLEREFEIYGYKEFMTYPDYNFEGYLYDVGDIVWLNIKLKPIVDMPLTRCGINTANWDNNNPHFEPVNKSDILKDRIVNLSAGIQVSLNFSFRILKELPEPGTLNSVIFYFHSEHSLVMITENGGRDYTTGGIGLSIWTTPSEKDYTRSNGRNQNYSDDILSNSSNMNVTGNGRRETYERKKLEI